MSLGDTLEGMRRLDEATAAAVAGEINDVDTNVTACCYLIAACELVRDYDRAARWCEHAREVAERVLVPVHVLVLSHPVRRRAHALG